VRYYEYIREEGRRMDQNEKISAGDLVILKGEDPDARVGRVVQVYADETGEFWAEVHHSGFIDYYEQYPLSSLELYHHNDYSGPEDNVNHPQHYVKRGVNSDGGPTSYYDFPPDWKTWNDFADYKAQQQWKEHSFHLGNIGKAICRWGDKGGTTKSYDARKIVYSGLRVLLMLEGKENVQEYLDNLREDPQFGN